MRGVIADLRDNLAADAVPKWPVPTTQAFWTQQQQREQWSELYCGCFTTISVLNPSTHNALPTVWSADVAIFDRLKCFETVNHFPTQLLDNDSELQKASSPPIPGLLGLVSHEGLGVCIVFRRRRRCPSPPPRTTISHRCTQGGYNAVFLFFNRQRG